jgi:hypothetical protein
VQGWEKPAEQKQISTQDWSFPGWNFSIAANRAQLW